MACLSLWRAGAMAVMCTPTSAYTGSAGYPYFLVTD